MAKYESFNNSTNKFEKIWERNETNTSEINNNLSKFQLDFNSINFNKKITTIPILKNVFIEDFIDEIVTIDLNNIPEWIINHINILPIVSPIGDINTDVVTTDTSNLQVGNLLFNSVSKHWIAKLVDNNYILKIQLFMGVALVTSVDVPEEGNFTGEPISFNLDLSLKIINPRIYEKVNIHKT